MSQPDVQPNFKTNFGECGCGCGLEGPLKKPWKNGQRCVKARCRCARCRGKMNRAKGDRTANKVRRQLQLPGPRSRHEETWNGPVLLEAKAGYQCKALTTAFLAARAQAESKRSVGDTRPFMMAAKADRGPQLFVIEADDLPQVVAGFMEHYGWVA